ncbi:MAG: transcriptional regulator [Alphaproteobacteria bacterium PA2]|nr:MAG: transcriptional regulator [Alphaproteobacteria bacterium PA2]
MSEIIAKRVCAEIEGDFVVFLIGMRINRPWKFWKWAPVAAAMPRMLIELGKQPDLGLLHARSMFGFPDIVVTQYWRSFDHLEAYAKSREAAHLPAWQAFNKAIGSNGDVGIWHETYLIENGRYENVYNNMPAFGLGLAGTLRDASGGRKEARGRVATAKL